MADGGGRHWLVRMEWHPVGWSVCLPQLVFPCTIKPRSSILAPAHSGGPGKRAVKQLWCGGVRKVEILDNGLFNGMQIFPRVVCNHDHISHGGLWHKHATHTMLGVLKMLFDINMHSCVSGLVCVHL